jgi:nicotinamide mononucleotide transporter
MNFLLNLKPETLLEILGTITGILYVTLAVKQNRWLFVLGFISSACYVYVFLVWKLYSLTLLQVYYLWISVYGWFLWKRQSTDETGKPKKLSTAWLTIREWIIYTGITLLLVVAIRLLLLYFTDSTQPWWDALCSALSITATFMLTYKKIENWLLWIITDVLMVILYASGNHWWSVVLYATYTFFAIIGFFEWKRMIKTESAK